MVDAASPLFAVAPPSLLCGTDGEAARARLPENPEGAEVDKILPPSGPVMGESHPDVGLRLAVMAGDMVDDVDDVGSPEPGIEMAEEDWDGSFLPDSGDDGDDELPDSVVDDDEAVVVEPEGSGVCRIKISSGNPENRTVTAHGSP